MASLIKLRHMPAIQNCAWRYLGLTRNISSTPSKKAGGGGASKCTEPIDPCNIQDNWVSYGFDYNNKAEDTSAHNASFFFSVTLCLVFGGFIWAYAPDPLLRDWALREAFLELRRREKEGLKPIDPNYIPPGSVQLPSEQELCDVEIII